MKDLRDLLAEEFAGDIILTTCCIKTNPNGADEYLCPFCGAYQYSHKNEYIMMNELNHDDDCLYSKALKYKQNPPVSVVPDEYILCSAIDYYGNLISGFRHKDCNNIIKLINPNITEEQLPSRQYQGFLTSKNRFVGRKEAWKIALANDQIKFGLEASDNGEDSELISENLYMLDDE